MHLINVVCDSAIKGFTNKCDSFSIIKANRRHLLHAALVMPGRCIVSDDLPNINIPAVKKYGR